MYINRVNLTYRAVSATTSSFETEEEDKSMAIQGRTVQKKHTAKKTWQDDEEATIVVYA